MVYVGYVAGAAIFAFFAGNVIARITADNLRELIFGFAAWLPIVPALYFLFTALFMGKCTPNCLNIWAFFVVFLCVGFWFFWYLAIKAGYKIGSEKFSKADE